ncbi:MAG: HlyD family efflux transporter periplasmic adaptor subunit [Crocinitomicaceae bacterium]
MKIRHIVIIAVFVLINIAVLATLNFGGEPKVEEDKKEEVFIQDLKGMEIKNELAQFEVAAYGTISSFQSVDVSSEVQGKLILGSKDLKVGNSFRKGELMFRVNDTEARYNIRSRKSGFITLIAQMLPDIKSDFPAEFDKWNDYVASIKLNESLPILPAWGDTKEKIFISTRNILTEYFAIKSMEEQLQKFTYYAPFNGVITEAYISEHAVVNPGSRIIKYVANGDFELAASVPTSQMDELKVGTTAKIYTTTGEEKGIGKVVRISDVINKMTQSADVFIKPTAYEGKKFVEGEYVKVQINEQGEFNGVRVPRQAVNDNTVYVYNKIDSTLNPKQITVLDINEIGVFVSGLDDSEVIITQEVLNYTDSTKYSVVLR